MAIKAVQQIMLGTVTGSEAKAGETLQAMVKAGYNGIELNSFMVNPTPFMVRMLTKAAGMPTGNGGKLDWAKLVKEAVVDVVGVLGVGNLVVEVEWGVVAHIRKCHTAVVVFKIIGVYKPHTVVHTHGKCFVVDYSLLYFVFTVSGFDVDAVRTADFYANVGENGVGFIGINLLPRRVDGDIIEGIGCGRRAHGSEKDANNGQCSFHNFHIE